MRVVKTEVGIVELGKGTLVVVFNKMTSETLEDIWIEGYK